MINEPICSAATDAIPQRSPLECEIQRLRQQLSLCEEMAQVLGDRLTSVLSPPVPSNVERCDKEEPNLSPLVIELRESGTRAMGINSTINDILERLEL